MLLSYDRSGPLGSTPLLLIHAGVADRRMWDPQWGRLTATYDVVRVDLRGFGDSTERPTGLLSPVDDVLAVLDDLTIRRCHMVGASYGAGVGVELALARPDLVSSLLLSAPDGSLMPEATDDLRAFFAAERAALADDDLDAAVEANLRTWVDGPHRGPDAVAPATRDRVRLMQRHAFEVTADWDDVEEVEPDPPALERLGEIGCRTTVLVGAMDLDAIHLAAAAVVSDIPGARRVDWPDVAHLPSLERPDDFGDLVDETVSDR